MWLALLAGGVAWAVEAPPLAKECFREPGPGPALAWCVTRLPGCDPGTVLYHLHGRNLDAGIWADPSYYTELLKRHWQDSGLTPPTIVTISYGPEWVLAPRGQAKRTGLREQFLERALPGIEKGLGGTTRARFLLGESMGGFNAIQLMDSGLFTRVAILCAPIYDIAYPITMAGTLDLVRRTGMEYKIALGFWWLLGDYVQSAGDWEAISPLRMAGSLDPARAPMVYLSCGSRDQYGNFSGSLRFQETLRQRGVNVQWRPLYTRHCGIDIPSLAEFLAVR
ncbi:MAG: esterase [Desulfarculus sp.]|nr:esterase [Desulfarculus sp.]